MSEEKKPRNSRKKLQYDVHVGALVAAQIEKDPSLSYQIVADRMGIGKAALAAKVKLPYFGTAETIADASLACGVNFFEEYLILLKKEGIPTDDEYANNKLLLNDMSKKNELLQEKINELEKMNRVLLYVIELPKTQ